MGVSSVNIRIGADIKQFQSNMKKVERNLKSVGKNMVSMGKKMVAPIAAVSAGLVIAANKSADYADKIDKASIRTGIARDTLQEMSFVADQAGVQFSTIEAAVAKLTKSMGDVEAGSIRQTEAFETLGIKTKDVNGEMRTISDIFPEVLSVLSKIPNVTQRNALAMELFGKQSQNLIPLLAELGDKGIEELSAKARELGLVMSNEGVASLVEYKDKMSQLTQQVSALTRDFSVGFADFMSDQMIPLLQSKVIPMFKTFLESIRNISPESKNMALAIGGITAAIGALLIPAGYLLTTVLPGLITAITFLAANPLTLVVGAVVAYTLAVTALNSELVKNLKLQSELAGKTPGQQAEVFKKKIQEETQALKNLKRVRDTLDEEGEIAAINRSIAKKEELIVLLNSKMKNALEEDSKLFHKKLEVLKKNIAAEEAMSKAIKENSAAIKERKKAKEDEFKIDKLKFSPDVEAELNRDDTELDFMPEVDDSNDFLEEGLRNYEEARDRANAISDSIHSAMVNSISGLGEAIAASLMGATDSFEMMFNTILASIADFGQQFGKQLISIGLAKIALENIGLSGIGAVAAGTALVATMAIVKKTLSQGAQIPGFAEGGVASGLSVVGEKGPELVNFGSPSRVFSNKDSKAMMGNGFGGELKLRVDGAGFFVWFENERRKLGNRR